MVDTVYQQYNQGTPVNANWLNDANQVTYRGLALWGTNTGTTDVLTATLSPVPIQYWDGMMIRVRVTATNTTTTPSINANGLGAVTITKHGGAALSAGDIPVGDVLLAYRASGPAFDLISGVSSGGGSKPTATSNQTATLVTGTFNMAQAFAQLDAYSYAGTPYTGTVAIPNGYVFTPADQLALISRPDVASWLQFVSAQFPTAHTTSGTFTTNLFGTFKALFGFVASGCLAFQVSVDDSANTGSSLITLFSSNSSLGVVGNFSLTKVVMRGAGVTQTVVLSDTLSSLLLVDADSILSDRGSGTNALITLGGVAKDSRISGNSFTLGSLGLTVKANTTCVIADNSPNLTVTLSSGSVSLTLGGDVLLLGTATVSALGGSGHAPFTLVNSGSVTTGPSVVWKPLASGEHFSLAGSLGAPTDTLLDVSRLTVDTSTTATFGNLVHVGTTTSTVTTAIKVLGSSQAAWGSNTLYNIQANASTTGAPSGYGVFITDLNARNFTASKGHVTLPGGLIVQWVQGSFGDVPPGGRTDPLTFDVAFPNAVMGASVSTLYNGGATIDVSCALDYTTLTTTGVTAAFVEFSSTVQNVAPMVWAWGY